jgi:hypothetical protein
VHGLAIGAGTSLDSAVLELETEAKRQATELTPRHREQRPVRRPMALPDRGPPDHQRPGGLRPRRGLGGIRHLDQLGHNTMVGERLGPAHGG